MANQITFQYHTSQHQDIRNRLDRLKNLCPDAGYGAFTISTICSIAMEEWLKKELAAPRPGGPDLCEGMSTNPQRFSISFRDTSPNGYDIRENIKKLQSVAGRPYSLMSVASICRYGICEWVEDKLNENGCS